MARQRIFISNTKSRGTKRFTKTFGSILSKAMASGRLITKKHLVVNRISLRAAVLTILLTLNASCAKKTQVIEIPALPVENIERCDYRSQKGHSYETIQKWSPLSADRGRKGKEWGQI
jgi:hypothetical protein